MLSFRMASQLEAEPLTGISRWWSVKGSLSNWPEFPQVSHFSAPYWGPEALSPGYLSFLHSFHQDWLALRQLASVCLSHQPLPRMLASPLLEPGGAGKPDVACLVLPGLVDANLPPPWLQINLWHLCFFSANPGHWGPSSSGLSLGDWHRYESDNPTLHLPRLTS